MSRGLPLGNWVWSPGGSRCRGRGSLSSSVYRARQNQEPLPCSTGGRRARRAPSTPRAGHRTRLLLSRAPPASAPLLPLPDWEGPLGPPAGLTPFWQSLSDVASGEPAGEAGQREASEVKGFCCTPPPPQHSLRLALGSWPGPRPCRPVLAGAAHLPSLAPVGSGSTPGQPLSY